MRELSHHVAAEAGRLLRLLFLRVGGVPTHAGSAWSLLREMNLAERRHFIISSELNYAHWC